MKRVERREFLKGLGGVAALGIAGPGALPLAGCGPDPQLESALLDFFDDRTSAAVVGREVLKARPQEDSARVLVEQLAGEDLPRWLELAATDREALHAAVRARHAADFAAERVVRVRGWVLSDAEARLCALVALSDEAV